MSFTADQLYALLPAVYRTRDAENGEPLKALMAVIAGQVAVSQNDIQQLYADEFIETCAEWVVPYIGDLIGADLIHETPDAAGRRAVVANTIAYRRRKGTLLNLEQFSTDVSGMPSVGVEFFRRLITTQSMRHLRPGNSATVDLRRAGALDRLNSAFDSLDRTIEVRRICPRVRPAAFPDPTPLDLNLHGGGKYNIPDIGVYLWRWMRDLQFTGSPAFAVDARRFLFSPLGQDMPLFNALPQRDPFAGLTTRMDVPQPISRLEFYRDIAAFYGPSFSLTADGLPIDVSRICCRDLSDGADGGWGVTCDGKVAIDPKLGRIQFAPDLVPPSELVVTFTYGSGGPVGGGGYVRTLVPPANPTFVATVGEGAATTLADAVALWNGQAAGATGIIVLPGFNVLSGGAAAAAAIQLPSTSQLWIVAAEVHPDGALSFDGSCTTLWGDLEVQGIDLPGPDGVELPVGQLYVSGLWVCGSLQVSGDAVGVNLMDCTLVPGLSLTREGSPVEPGEPSIVVDAVGAALTLANCISGPIGAAPGGSVCACSSVIDSCNAGNVAYAGPDLASEGADLHVEDCTVIGKVWTRTMKLASNSIFRSRRGRHDPWEAAVWCSRRQAGCVRFSFVPTDALTPKQFRCLPVDQADEAALAPMFITLEFGQPSYAMLSGYVPMAVWTGADDGNEMGAFRARNETLSIQNVQGCAPDYLPFGLELGIFLEPSQPIPKPVRPHGYGYGAAKAGPRPADDAAESHFPGIGSHLL